MGSRDSESLSTVVEAGDRRRSLEAIRNKLATELDASSGKDTAVIAQRLVAVIAELDSLAGAKKGTADDLAAKRAARRAAAAGPAGA